MKQISALFPDEGGSDSLPNAGNPFHIDAAEERKGFVTMHEYSKLSGVSN
jgi:hypothetical protein